MECVSESGLFNTVVSSFTHSPANSKVLFFFVTEYTPLCVRTRVCARVCVCTCMRMCMYACMHMCGVFISHSVDGHLGCFHNLAILSSAQ